MRIRFRSHGGHFFRCNQWVLLRLCSTKSGSINRTSRNSHSKFQVSKSDLSISWPNCFSTVAMLFTWSRHTLKWAGYASRNKGSLLRRVAARNLFLFCLQCKLDTHYYICYCSDHWLNFVLRSLPRYLWHSRFYQITHHIRYGDYFHICGWEKWQRDAHIIRLDLKNECGSQKYTHEPARWDSSYQLEFVASCFGQLWISQALWFTKNLFNWIYQLNY